MQCLVTFCIFTIGYVVTLPIIRHILTRVLMMFSLVLHIVEHCPVSLLLASAVHTQMFMDMTS